MNYYLLYYIFCWIIFQTRSYGISSLSQDLNGVYISASCMDSRYGYKGNIWEFIIIFWLVLVLLIFEHFYKFAAYISLMHYNLRRDLSKALKDVILVHFLLR